MARRSRVPELIAALDKDGVVRRRADLVSEFGKNAVDSATRDGAILAVLPSIYAHPLHRRSFMTRVGAALLWLAPDVVLSGSAACSMFGMDVHRLFPVTIVVNRRIRIRARYWLRLRRHEYVIPSTVRAGLRVASLPCALIQAWIDEGSRVGKGLILDAIRDDKTDAIELIDSFRYYPKISRRRELRGFLEHLKDGIDSYLEWVADQTVLNVPDLARLQRQKEFWIDGEHYFVDAYCDETKTAFEFDGKKYHNDDAARRRDIKRDRALATIGVQVIRFTFEEVTGSPEACRDTIRKTISARRPVAA